jgi:hypothetical protein
MKDAVIVNKWQESEAQRKAREAQLDMYELKRQSVMDAAKECGLTVDDVTFASCEMNDIVQAVQAIRIIQFAGDNVRQAMKDDVPFSSTGDNTDATDIQRSVMKLAEYARLLTDPTNFGVAFALSGIMLATDYARNYGLKAA